MTQSIDLTVNPRRERLSAAECQWMVTEYAPLVGAIARSLVRRLPTSVETDDLVQDGMIAIIQSIPMEAGKSQYAYLSQRIRGAMIDGLRENALGSRKVRQEMRRVELASLRFCHRVGRIPREGELAEVVGMTLKAYQSLLWKADECKLFSLDDLDGNQHEYSFILPAADLNSDPLAVLEGKAAQDALLRALEVLTERQRAVVQAYYGDDFTMREIGVRLGITEGRVSQIHANAIAKLKAAILGDGNDQSSRKAGKVPHLPTMRSRPLRGEKRRKVRSFSDNSDAPYVSGFALSLGVQCVL